MEYTGHLTEDEIRRNAGIGPQETRRGIVANNYILGQSNHILEGTLDGVSKTVNDAMSSNDGILLSFVETTLVEQTDDAIAASTSFHVTNLVDDVSVENIGVMQESSFAHYTSQLRDVSFSDMTIPTVVGGALLANRLYAILKDESRSNMDKVREAMKETGSAMCAIPASVYGGIIGQAALPLSVSLAPIPGIGWIIPSLAIEGIVGGTIASTLAGCFGRTAVELIL